MCDANSANIERWVKIATESQDLSNHQIEMEGHANKGDGHTGEINFVKVTGTTKDGKQKSLNFAIKSSQTVGALREKVPIKEAYMKEIYIYERVKPIFEKFLQENGVDEIIDFMPHCYATEMAENSEALIFENMRAAGFQLWDSSRPVTFQHARLVLEAYGKWHALSMALKLRKPKAFEDLTKDNINMFTNVLNTMKLDDAFAHEFENVRTTAVSPDEKDIFKHIQYSSTDVKYAFNDMFFEDPENHVILHGDCWNNNFIFKSLDDVTNPSDVSILDWQCSGLGSVAFDLSHFIYCCVDTGKHDDVKEMLKIYYDTFSKYLTLLGCNPETVFSFDKLQEQWKKFSRFGLFLSCWIIRMCMMKPADVPDLEEAAKKDPDLGKSVTFQASNDEAFVKRVRNNFLHYVKNVQ